MDFGKSLRGHRIFGDNKMWRGLVVMPLASSFAFAIFAANRDELPVWLQAGLWLLPIADYALLGFSCGLAFMLAELPNSFLKRQMDITPGGVSQIRELAVCCLLFDRFDSSLGVLLALQLQVPLSWQTWLYTLGIGGGIHWIFSYLLYLLGIKARPS
jgi:CDP-2,3-bis-(O-geranylgeranyl)-sn-glycerol synthase